MGRRLEADIFAGEFLVPLKTLKKAFRQQRDYVQLARQFSVGRAVMYHRFRDARLWNQVA